MGHRDETYFLQDKKKQLRSFFLFCYKKFIEIALMQLMLRICLWRIIQMKNLNIQTVSKVNNWVYLLCHIRALEWIDSLKLSAVQRAHASKKTKFLELEVTETGHEPSTCFIISFRPFDWGFKWLNIHWRPISNAFCLNIYVSQKLCFCHEKHYFTSYF